MHSEKQSLAVMQPYLFPYIGYMSLVDAVDCFVFYDDVNFIKKGWINRNYVIADGKPYEFSLPLRQISQNKLIIDTFPNDIESFFENFSKLLERSYSKAKNFHVGMEYVQSTLQNNSMSVAGVAEMSVRNFFEVLGLSKCFLRSSVDFKAAKCHAGVGRIIKICEIQKANEYVNAIGGRDLYSQSQFNEASIKLKFLMPIEKTYLQQNVLNFEKNLSVIDLLMNLSKDEIHSILKSYKLIRI